LELHQYSYGRRDKSGELESRTGTKEKKDDVEKVREACPGNDHHPLLQVR
jgi:hypothetical protein